MESGIVDEAGGVVSSTESQYKYAILIEHGHTKNVTQDDTRHDCDISNISWTIVYSVNGDRSSILHNAPGY